jgi:hypothetical protein
MLHVPIRIQNMSYLTLTQMLINNVNITPVNNVGKYHLMCI